MSQEKLYIGLDAGGSKTELLARSTTPAEDLSLHGPAANLQRQGQDGTAGVLADLVKQALALRPQAMLGGICAGIAGAGRPAERQALADRIRQLLGEQAPQHLLIVHDADIALEGAFEGGSGIIVIAGTGSVALARTQDGTRLRVGGWGYLLGDEGSGHVLGLQGLQAVAHAIDGGPATRIRDLVAERLDVRTPEDLIHIVYAAGWPVQQAAPLVLEAADDGDAVARRILTEQTRALATQIGWLAAQCEAIDRRIALLGGLVRNATYRTALIHALHRHLPGWHLQKPAHPAVAGALRLAQQVAQQAG